jgi:hypothetical protein
MQAYDLGDPWGASMNCHNWRCCGYSESYVNMTKCHAESDGKGWDGTGCHAYCTAWNATMPFMGGIHPRDKMPVGRRLAQAAVGVVYESEYVSAHAQTTEVQTKPALPSVQNVAPVVSSDSHAFTGPTLAGCSVDSSVTADPSTSSGLGGHTTRWMEVRFRQDLLRGDKVIVQPYGNSSSMYKQHGILIT